MAQHVSYRTVKVDGLSIFYREAGPKDAPTILLLHGLPSSSRMFEPLLTRLADQFHMVAPDYPGFGHSDAPTSKEFSYTFDNIATVMDHFTEALNLTGYTLYMQGYGGPVGFRMTLAHPDRVEALIVSKCRRPQRRPRNELEDQACVLGGPRLTRGHAADQLALAGRHADAARGERPEPREVRSRSVDRRIRVLSKPGEADIQSDLFYDYRSNVDAYPTWQAWMQKTQPRVLVLWGKYDVSFELTEPEAYRCDVPKAQVHVLDAGHFALDTAAEEIADLVRRFVSNAPDP
jgi:pimeloyl-ACP methyl ester carboxylesterase